VVVDGFALFYYHEATQKSQWTMPRELYSILGEWKEISSKQGFFYFNKVAQLSLWDDPRAVCDVFTSVLQGNFLFLQLFSQ